MRFLISIVVAMLISGAAQAADFNNPLVQGQIVVKARAAASRLGATDTASLGAVRTDTGEVIFCSPAGPGATVEGMTKAIVATTEDIFIVFYAYADPECSALHSQAVPSTDRYRVVFGAPGQPLLLELVTP